MCAGLFVGHCVYMHIPVLFAYLSEVSVVEWDA